MALPTKSITTRTGHMSKNEIDARIEYEAKLRGESDDIRPPSFLSEEQKTEIITITGVKEGSTKVICKVVYKKAKKKGQKP